MIERLLGGMSPDEFLNRHYHRLPMCLPGTARPLTKTACWETVEEILGRPEVDAFIARDGRMEDGGAAPTYARARERFAEGSTVVIRGAELHHDGVADLAGGFRQDLDAPVNVHLYATPALTTGFGWHYDVEDVFILQGSGEKEYRLRKNTVHPWPTLRTMPRDLGYQNEVSPMMTVTLAEGDWLYIPPGWWHRAEARKDALTLAVGLMSPTALDLLDFLRDELARMLPWRQRLPPTGRAAGGRSAEEVREAHRAVVADLARDLDRAMADEGLLRRWMGRTDSRSGT